MLFMCVMMFQRKATWLGQQQLGIPLGRRLASSRQPKVRRFDSFQVWPRRHGRLWSTLPAGEVMCSRGTVPTLSISALV